ncbi:MAG: hypothetical protein ASARMPRED_002645 [Alectoria sarmentosa]|nr:MAG: hypothetical protein ASARMPRED_002645 [Alectoria sarmentosa]
MRRISALSKHLPRLTPSRDSTTIESPPIIRIENGTFYRKYPSATDQDAASKSALFRGLTWYLPSKAVGDEKQQHWAVLGLSNAGKTTFFDVIRGHHLCIPPAARSFPYLSSKEVEIVDSRYRNVARAIQHVGFDGERGGVAKSGTRGAYLSARYESRREATDFSVMEFLKGNTDLNPSEEQEGKEVNDQSLDKVISDLKLEALVHMPMGNLSNGQTRRARIARALLGKPMVLLLDEPFMGLDPSTMTTLSPLLHSLARASSPRLILALRPQDPLPDWITHVIHLGPNFQITYQGSKDLVDLGTARAKVKIGKLIRTDYLAQIDVPDDVIPQRGLTKAYQNERIRHLPGSNYSFQQSNPTESREGIPWVDADVPVSINEALVEMQDVCVRPDKTRTVMDLPNELIDTYSLPIKVFGRGRLPQPGLPGISIFDIQSRIGQSSPEIHAFFPRNLSLRQALENAWADTFLGTPRLKYENDVTVDTCLRWFEAELNPAFTPLTISFITKAWKSKNGFPNSIDWADNIRFGDAPFSAQRVVLFLRAIIKKPDIVVLDEAFSGMDDRVRDKCMLFLTWGETKSFGVLVNRKEHVKERFVYDTPPQLLSERILEGLSKNQALICVSHIKEEVPGVVRRWMSLPEAGTGNVARFGKFPGPLEGYDSGWDEIWGV